MASTRGRCSCWRSRRTPSSACSTAARNASSRRWRPPDLSTGTEGTVGGGSWEESPKTLVPSASEASHAGGKPWEVRAPLPAGQPGGAAAAAAFGDGQRVALQGGGQPAFTSVLRLHRGNGEQREGARLGEPMNLPQAGRRRWRGGLLGIGHRALGRAVVGAAVDDARFDDDVVVERRAARAHVAAAAPLAIQWTRRLGEHRPGRQEGQTERQQRLHLLPNSLSMSASLSST